MNGTDIYTLLPLIVVTAASVAVMLAIAIRRSHFVAAALTLLGLAAAFDSLWFVAPYTPRQVTPLLAVDRYALFYMGMIILAAIFVVLLSYAYLQLHQGDREELYLLLLISTLGALVLVASSHFVSFFLGLELLSVPLYAMIAYFHTWKFPLEAGLKYLVLAAASASFLLFGMALIYAETGTMQFALLGAFFTSGAAGINRPLVLAGLALILTGVGFKLAVVPFHMWTPDVYQGAPAPVTAFVATVSKGAMFGLLLRFYSRSGAHLFEPIYVLFTIVAIASMIGGNLLALLQDNVKRILAYSSIAHLGYVLVAFQAGGTVGASAVTFYLVAYFITTLGAFGVIALLSTPERDADQLEDYRGLFWRRPAVAGVFTAMLFSLAGIPLTAGFLGKFYVVAAGANATIWALIIILVVTSAIGLYYYLRIVTIMYSAVRPEDEFRNRPSIPFSGSFALVVLTALLIWFGVFPFSLLDAIRTAAASLI